LAWEVFAVGWEQVKRMHDSTSVNGGTGRARTSPGQWIALALIVALAGCLRLGAVDRLLPQRPEPDAHIQYQLEVFTGHSPRDQAPPHFGFYPTFLARTLAWCAGKDLYSVAPPQAPLEAHVAAASRPLVALRTWVALIGTAGVAWVFLLARKLLGPGWALGAAAFLALSLLHNVYSHQARPHAAHMTFQVLALFLLLRQIERPSAASVIAAALGAWLCLSNLQSGVFLLPAYALAGLFAPSSWRLRALAAGAAGVALLASRSFYVGGIQISASGISLAPAGGHPISFAELDGSGVAPTAGFLWGYEPVLAVLAPLGLLLGAIDLARGWRSLGRSRALALASLGAYFLPYAAFTLLNRETRDRYLLPLLPLLALLALYALKRLAALAPQGWRGRVSALVCLVALVLPAADGARYWRWVRADDSVERAAAWLAANVPDERTPVVVSPHYMPPLRYSREALAENAAYPMAGVAPWLLYQMRAGPIPPERAQYFIRPMSPLALVEDRPGSDLEQVLSKLAPAYVVLDLSGPQRALPGHRTFEEIVRRNATRVAVFGPEGEGAPDEELLAYGDTTRMRARLRRAEMAGPPLEIYRWNQP
jgi:hypothetical protein